MAAATSSSSSAQTGSATPQTSSVATPQPMMLRIVVLPACAFSIDGNAPLRWEMPHARGSLVKLNSRFVPEEPSYRHAEEQEAPAISGRERDRAADDPRGPSVLVARLWRRDGGGLALHLGAVLHQCPDLYHRPRPAVAA